MPQLELLAPARNAATAIDAINHGADAIYMGAAKFGAREQAANSFDEIKKVVDYAHLFNVKVFSTVNTIFFDNEKEELREMVIKLWDLGVDALIIQDTGLLEMNLPPMCFHVSTQANNRTLERIKFWEKTGVSRIVLARELSINEISNIRQHTNIELEAFIHGALCVSYSGSCYMSCDMNNRSANRGNCSQPCRLPYDLTDSNGSIIRKNEHLISLNDLDTSTVIDDMIRAGITSFKIEGRLKDPLYVKNITAHYSKLLNRFIEKNSNYTRSSKGICTIGFVPDPEKSFNRGTVTHFLKGRSIGLVNPTTPKSMGKLVGKVTKIEKKMFATDSYIDLVKGDGICFNHNGTLLGTQITATEGKWYKPQDISGITIGTNIYRNRDHNFIKQVERSDTPRKRTCSINISFIDNKIQITALSDTISTQTTTEYTEIAENREKATNTWQIQMAKSGDTCFTIQNIDIEGEKTAHLPVSTINTLRREILAILENKIRQNHFDSRQTSKINTIDFYKQSIDYHENVSNSLAQQFYQKRGVKHIENAFELIKPDKSEYVVMTTKYCILFELGYCLKSNNKKQPFKLPLYLSHKERKYRLEFNCKECQMIIKRVVNQY